MAVKMNVWEGSCMVWGKGTRSQRGERSQEEVGDGGEGKQDPAMPQKARG